MAKRLKAMGQHRYLNGFSVTLQPDLLNQPDKWISARTIFVNSMSDLFHQKVSFGYIKKVFATIRRNPHHTFQVLTKRSSRLAKLSNKLTWPHNLWIGVSVENSDYLSRINDLRTVPAAVRFLSCEPLIGPLFCIDLTDIQWVIVGGESGPKSRPIKKEWVRSIQKECLDQNVPFFFKQWGGFNKKKAGRHLDGRTWDEMPMHFRSSKQNSTTVGGRWYNRDRQVANPIVLNRS
jgi:protein gp37